MEVHQQSQVLRSLETNSDDSDSDSNSPSIKAHRRCLDLRSLLRRRSGGSNEISGVAGSIGSELNSWIDRLLSSTSSSDEKSAILTALESRLCKGFDRSFQYILLKSAAFSAVEYLLSDPASPTPVRDRSAAAILAFIRFNKAVFVGGVLMGPTLRSLVSMATATSIRVLNGLIASIRSPIVDQLHADGEISKIITLLCESNEIEIRILAFDAVLEIGYFGSKEAIDEMLERGLIERLVELQRSELGGSLIEMDGVDENSRPFASCVWRFAVQMKVGEGLGQRERSALKVEVLRRVREAVRLAAEVSTIFVEVLWGPTHW